MPGHREGEVTVLMLPPESQGWSTMCDRPIPALPGTRVCSRGWGWVALAQGPVLVFKRKNVCLNSVPPAPTHGLHLWLPQRQKRQPNTGQSPHKGPQGSRSQTVRKGSSWWLKMLCNVSVVDLLPKMRYLVSNELQTHKQVAPSQRQCPTPPRWHWPMSAGILYLLFIYFK